LLSYTKGIRMGSYWDLTNHDLSLVSIHSHTQYWSKKSLRILSFVYQDHGEFLAIRMISSAYRRRIDDYTSEE
jgi:hypothetical protein